ncbi:M20/M25/M40 family metallo-hydrolase [Evansella sp. AB-rgal1]|uniref:M20/M25/M40 family metallo-hydrolase n=1 Tax=Evansella sp. AB-rgal1 TaxID=3242696 RepID=UPI00359E65A9
MTKWQSKEGLQQLTVSLAELESITGSKQEIEIMDYVEEELRILPYFQKNKSLLQTHETEDGRKIVTALVKSKRHTRKTVVLMGHIDVVDVEDYGEYKEWAFRPLQLTEKLYAQKRELPERVQFDLENEEWLFGRGTMDMKAGIAICMSMIEWATLSHFEGNILFLAVPDEEVNSVGMRAATPVLLQLAEKYDLRYELIWNTEPMFESYPGDNQLYIYQGSVGKMLPGFYCYGKEAHVGEPFAGLNGNFMTSVLTQVMELNPGLSEQVGDERTPPPSNLSQKDLKDGYSVQIPHAAISIYNLLTMEKSTTEVTKDLLKHAKIAADKIVKRYKEREEKYTNNNEYKPRERKIRVLTYEDLVKHAKEKVGHEEIEKRIIAIKLREPKWDDRELTYFIVHEIATISKELAPMIVLFYAPPYYPHVSSASNTTVKNISAHIIEVAKSDYDLDIKTVQFFPGLSDLSYTSLQGKISDISSLTKNMPLWEVTYDLPLEDMRKLNCPVINFGPIGKDPHSWTERLNITFTFEKLPQIMKKSIQHLFQSL